MASFEWPATTPIRCNDHTQWRSTLNNTGKQTRNHVSGMQRVQANGCNSQQQRCHQQYFESPEINPRGPHRPRKWRLQHSKTQQRLLDVASYRRYVHCSEHAFFAGLDRPVAQSAVLRVPTGGLVPETCCQGLLITSTTTAITTHPKLQVLMCVTCSQAACVCCRPQFCVGSPGRCPLLSCMCWSVLPVAAASHVAIVSYRDAPQWSCLLPHTQCATSVLGGFIQSCIPLASTSFTFTSRWYSCTPAQTHSNLKTRSASTQRWAFLASMHRRGTCNSACSTHSHSCILQLPCSYNQEFVSHVSRHNTRHRVVGAVPS